MNGFNFSYNMHFLNEGKWQREREKDKTEVIRNEIEKFYNKAGEAHSSFFSEFYIDSRAHPTKKIFFFLQHIANPPCVSSRLRYVSACMAFPSTAMPCEMTEKNIFMYQEIFFSCIPKVL